MLYLLAGFCLDASFLLSRDAAKQFRQSTQGRLPVAVLCSVSLRFYYDDTISTDAVIRKRAQSYFEPVGNR